MKTTLVAVLLALLPGLAAASVDLGPVKLDAGGTALIGVSGFVADDTGAGQAGYQRDAAQPEAYILGRISAETTLGDGLTGALYIRARAYETPESRTDVLPDRDEVLKDAYLRLRSDVLGEFRIGWQADVRQNSGLGAPQVCGCQDGFYGTDAPEITPMHGPIPANTTTGDFDERAPKLGWYSPVEGGLRVALSYGPFVSRGRRIDGLLDDDAPSGDRLQDSWSAAAVWNQTVDETSLGFEAGISGAQRAGSVIKGIDDRDPLVWGGGVSIGYAAWKFGAAYEQQNGIDLEGIYGAAAYRLLPGSVTQFRMPATNDIVTRTFDIGATYSIGPVTAGLAWSRGLYEGLADPGDAKHVAANDIVFAGLQYRIERWASLLGGVEWNRYDPGGGAALPGSAGLARVYGGADPTLNIWARRYDGVALVFGVALRY
jgi:predicted porin